MPRYRILIEDVGRDLTSFPSTTVLSRVIEDALLCHSEAQFKSNILRRDISPSNILITEEDSTGILADWDLHKPGQQGDSHSRGYVGTWQFMSGNLLQKLIEKVHDYVDDLESFLHTQTLTLARFSSSSLDPTCLPRFLSRFDEWSQYDGEIEGGEAKCDKLRGLGGYVGNLDFPGGEGLRGVFVDWFFPVYAYPWQQNEVTRAQIEALKTETGGEAKISGNFLNLL